MTHLGRHVEAQLTGSGEVDKATIVLGGRESAELHALRCVLKRDRHLKAITIKVRQVANSCSLIRPIKVDAGDIQHEACRVSKAAGKPLKWREPSWCSGKLPGLSCPLFELAELKFELVGSAVAIATAVAPKYVQAALSCSAKASLQGGK